MYMLLRWQPTTWNHEIHCRDRDGDGAEGRLELQLEWQIGTMIVMGCVNGRWVRREESGMGREEEDGGEKKRWSSRGESHW